MVYVKPKNDIFARHHLATQRQESGEMLDQYLKALKQLSKDCNFRDATAAQCHGDSIRHSLINALQSAHIHLQLFEKNTLDLQSAFD